MYVYVCVIEQLDSESVSRNFLKFTTLLNHYVQKKKTSLVFGKYFHSREMGNFFPNLHRKTYTLLFIVHLSSIFLKLRRAMEHCK